MTAATLALQDVVVDYHRKHLADVCANCAAFPMRICWSASAPRRPSVARRCLRWVRRNGTS